MRSKAPAIRLHGGPMDGLVVDGRLIIGASVHVPILDVGGGHDRAVYIPKPDGTLLYSHTEYVAECETCHGKGCYDEWPERHIDNGCETCSGTGITLKKRADPAPPKEGV